MTRYLPLALVSIFLALAVYYAMGRRWGWAAFWFILTIAEILFTSTLLVLLGHGALHR